MTFKEFLTYLFIAFVVVALGYIWYNTDETNDTIKNNTILQEEILAAQEENNAQAIEIIALSIQANDSQKLVKLVCDDYGWPCGEWDEEDLEFVCFTVPDGETCNSEDWVTSTYVFNPDDPE